MIFLRLAEGTSGEVDGIITALTTNTDSNEYRDFLNFTQISSLPNATNFNFAPRKNFEILVYPDQAVTKDASGFPEITASSIESLE